MHVGMLWYDNTPGVTLKLRIEKAANYYRQKYHQEPNLCLIHPSMLEKGRSPSKGDADLPQVGKSHDPVIWHCAPGSSLDRYRGQGFVTQPGVLWPTKENGRRSYWNGVRS